MQQKIDKMQKKQQDRRHFVCHYKPNVRIELQLNLYTNSIYDFVER